MATIHKSALVPFSASVMYALVNDVAKYPEFLPWCAGSKVLEQSDNEMLARVDINKGVFKQSFTTKNILDKNQTIKMALQDGPFKVLEGEWIFHSLKKGTLDGCKIELDLHWSFASGITNKLLGGVFSPIASKMVESFVNRANSIYGTKL